MALSCCCLLSKVVFDIVPCPCRLPLKGINLPLDESLRLFPRTLRPPDDMRLGYWSWRLVRWGSSIWRVEYDPGTLNDKLDAAGTRRHLKVFLQHLSLASGQSAAMRDINGRYLGPH